jgi:hypothetical protein
MGANMKKLCIASILLTLSAPLVAQSVSFTAGGIAAGESWTDEGSYASNMTLTVFNSQQTLPAVKHDTGGTRSKSVKITDVAGDGHIRSLEVTYTSASEPNVAGHTYTVSSSGNSIDVGYAGGSGTPSASEVAFVKADNAHFGQLSALNKVLGGKTFTVGNAISPINKNDASELIDNSGGIALDTISLTLQSVSGSGADQIATLTGTMTASGGIKSNAKPADETANDEKFSGDLHSTMNVTLKVRTATCRPVELRLESATTVAAARSAKGAAGKGRDKMTVSGDGSSSLHLNYSF